MRSASRGEKLKRRELDDAAGPRLRERPSGQEGRWPVGAVRSRQEDAVGDGRVEMGVAVEPRAEAVEEGDGADSRAGGD
ncbi:MAG: hypothetical protein WCO76_14700 [Planctomycetota bacterium]